MRLIPAAVTLAAFLGLTLPALAQPVNQREARQMLFNARGFDVDYVEGGGLTETQLGYFKIIVESRNSRDQFGRLAHYYGAIAISPSVFEGGPAALLTDPEAVPFRFETGYHSVAAAEAAALAGCDTLVSRGEAACVVAARILPKRYRDRDLTMSVFATQAFRAYRQASRPKAFAISPATRAYGLADGAAAVDEALAICNQAAAQLGGADCVIVVEDAE